MGMGAMPDLRDRLAKILADALLASEEWQAREAVVEAAKRWHPTEWRESGAYPCEMCAALARLDAGTR